MNDNRDLIGKIATTVEQAEVARKNEHDNRLRAAGVDLINRAGEQIEWSLDNFVIGWSGGSPLHTEMNRLLDDLHQWEVDVTAGAALILSVDRGRADQ